MSFHTPHGSARHRLPWSWTSFDYRTLCEELWEQCDARFEVAKVERRTRRHGHTDRGPLRAPLIVDALGWRRVLGPGANVQPPEARISRGLEVHPEGGGVDLDVWIDRSLIRRGYAWSVPADGEQRVGVGSYEPRDHVKEPTREIAARVGVPPVRYQGNWFPHQLRPAVEDGVFFVGDSAGHCFPLSGEGIRTAFYFGIACGRELRARAGGRADPRGARSPLRRVLAPPRARVRMGARAAAADPGPAAAAARAACSRSSGGAGSPTAPTAGTCARPTRRSPLSAAPMSPSPRRRPSARPACPADRATRRRTRRGPGR